MPKPREFPDNAMLFAALRAGQINAAWTTEATPNIPAELVVLSDKTALIRAENLVPLYRRNELNEQQVLSLNEVAGVLDSGSLVDMRRQVAETVGDYDLSYVTTADYDYMLAYANMNRQQRNNRMALTSFARASELSLNDDTARRSLYEVADEEGYPLNKTLSMGTEFRVNPIYAA